MHQSKIEKWRKFSTTQKLEYGQEEDKRNYGWGRVGGYCLTVKTHFSNTPLRLAKSITIYRFLVFV